MLGYLAESPVAAWASYVTHYYRPAADPRPRATRWVLLLRGRAAGSTPSLAACSNASHHTTSSQHLQYTSRYHS